MLTLSKILCAVDFSKCSRLALEAAADLAKRFDAELTVLHVRLPPLPPDDALLSDPSRLDEGRRELEQVLETWRREAELIAGRPVRPMLTLGAAGDEVVIEAKAGGYDLVVTGTHSRKGLRHMLLGSVAERIVREAPCPVLVARAQAEPGD